MQHKLSLINEKGMFQTEIYMVDILSTQIYCFLQCTYTQVQHVSYIIWKFHFKSNNPLNSLKYTQYLANSHNYYAQNLANCHIYYTQNLANCHIYYTQNLANSHIYYTAWMYYIQFSKIILIQQFFFHFCRRQYSINFEITSNHGRQEIILKYFSWKIGVHIFYDM